MTFRFLGFAYLLTIAISTPDRLAAQPHPHGAPPSPATTGGRLPQAGGQAVFAAVAEIVGLLEADSTTDWGRVDLERLRQHLLDMDAVATRTRVASSWVPAGEQWRVTGAGAVVGAIRRMTRDHAAMVEAEGQLRVVRQELPTGVLLTVTARDPMDKALVRKIRALDFIGFMAGGTHHQAHHLALARGEAHAHQH
jgi:hypothetical protein